MIMNIDGYIFDPSILDNPNYYGPSAWDIEHGMAAPMKHCYLCMKKTHHYETYGPTSLRPTKMCIVCDISGFTKYLGYLNSIS